MRSTSGYYFTLGSRVSSWSSKKQEIVAQFTAEAEFIVAITAVNQALFAQKDFNGSKSRAERKHQDFC